MSSADFVSAARAISLLKPNVYQNYHALYMLLSCRSRTRVPACWRLGKAGSRRGRLPDGLLVSPRTLSARFISSTWVFASTEHAFSRLFRLALEEEQAAEISFSLPFSREAEKLRSGGTVTRDLGFVRTGRGGVVRNPGARLVVLSPGSLRDADSEIGEALGDVSTLPRGRLYGLRVAGRVVCVVETFVRAFDVVCLQQLFTPSSLRGRGYATDLVSRLARRLASAGARTTYVASESNIASVTVARNAGFELQNRWGVWNRAT